MPDMENLYGSDSPTAPGSETPPAKSTEETDAETKTALLPKSVFPEVPKPGDVCDFDVVRVLDEQVMVKYHQDEGGESEHGMGMGEESSTEASPESGMAEYMS